jgi:serine-type D-Ala-D-Ala carboxypeptidase (penicillin-binding protein 5/6)
MRPNAGRWSLAAAGVALAVVPAVVLLRLQPNPARPAVAAAAGRGFGVVADASRPPWYGLILLRDSVTWRASERPPVKPPVIKASAAILVDPDTGRILWQLNAHQRLAPASTIKMLTALLVLENFNPERLVTITASALTQAPDESKMFLHAGQTLSVRELLTGLLTVSANDAAEALAVDTVGLERFVGGMNVQAAALGLHDTHAASPVGLDNPRTYSSAYDLATLATVDVRHFPLLRSIVAMPWASLPATSLHPAFFLDNVNLLLHMYPAAVGIKTGYTGNAGACEVGMAVRNGHRLISVVLNGELVYTESRRLLDWGFTQEGLPSQLPSPSPSPSPSPHH